MVASKARVLMIPGVSFLMSVKFLFTKSSPHHRGSLSPDIPATDGDFSAYIKNLCELSHPLHKDDVVVCSARLS